MNLEEQLRAERECTRLCNDFAWSVDQCDYDAFVRLFADDGVFERGGQASEGSAAIRSFLDGRPQGRVTRHLCANIRIDMTSAETAVGTCSALMFQAPAESSATPSQPLPVSTPVVVDYVDDYVLTHVGWKFKKRRTMLVFQP
ncbi:nuclear transport factor 2 family protein [Variovorax sp. dw_954]|uniref:nuclear transport factor 2 family protein n=1 Tax=Variovorax sp. dw_954 TaxID=2720078 RepID=UPI001BD3BC68|nr:nuclear transport factor 2 family protein [Variovorax sp. dw_954]